MEMITQAMRGETREMKQNMNEKMDGMAQTMREEMQCMGAGQQEGQEQLKGEMEKNMTAVEQFKIGQGELRRATCWGRPAKVTECTETRETEGELDGVKEAAHTHTHTEVARDNGGELAERVGTRCEQLGGLPRERGEGVCPLEAGCDQAGPVVLREVEGKSAADGCTRSLGGM